MQSYPAHPHQLPTVDSPPRTCSSDPNPRAPRRLPISYRRPKSKTTDSVAFVLVRELIDPPGSCLPIALNPSPTTTRAPPSFSHQGEVLEISAAAVVAPETTTTHHHHPLLSSLSRPQTTTTNLDDDDDVEVDAPVVSATTTSFRPASFRARRPTSAASLSTPPRPR